MKLMQSVVCGRRAARLAVLVAGLAAVASAPSLATVAVYESIGEVGGKADAVVRGTVTEVSVHWTRDRKNIYTKHRLRVDEVVAGPLTVTPQVEIVFTQLGGEIDGLALDYLGRPTFEEGEEVVVFLLRRAPNHYIVYGMKSGVLRVHGKGQDARWVREWGGMGLVDGPAAARGGREAFEPGEARRLVGEGRATAARARRGGAR